LDQDLYDIGARCHEGPESTEGLAERAHMDKGRVIRKSMKGRRASTLGPDHAHSMGIVDYQAKTRSLGQGQ
jgi:hypothetical protein